MDVKEFLRPFVDECTVYYRCSGTGKPTQAHIINEYTNLSFCGFDSPTAEVFDNDYSSQILLVDVCKKCLKSHNKWKQQKTQE